MQSRSKSQLKPKVVDLKVKEEAAETINTRKTQKSILSKKKTIRPPSLKNLQLLPVPTRAPPAEATKMMKEAATILGKKMFKVLTPLMNQTMVLWASTLMLSPIITLTTSMNMIQMITVMRETSIAPMDLDPRRMSTAAST